MPLLLSFGFLLLLLSVALWKAYSANREAKKLAKHREEVRRQREQELMEKVQKLKNRNDTDRAKAAIERDPKRAAKVVGKMMKKK